MKIKNEIVSHALQSALKGGDVSPVPNKGKGRKTAQNARKRAVVLNVRPPSNPARNKGGRIVSASAVSKRCA